MLRPPRSASRCFSDKESRQASSGAQDVLHERISMKSLATRVYGSLAIADHSSFALTVAS
jgi:hypothetical protein